MTHELVSGFRTTELPPNLLYWLSNLPEILPFVAPGCGSVDMAGFYATTRNVALGGERGAMIFGFMGNRQYEAHYLFTKNLRGVAALRFARSCLTLMFTAYAASAIHGATPRDNRAARMMNRALGAVPLGEFIDEQGRAFIKYVLERKQWATSSVAS